MSLYCVVGFHLLVSPAALSPIRNQSVGMAPRFCAPTSSHCRRRRLVFVKNNCSRRKVSKPISALCTHEASVTCGLVLLEQQQRLQGLKLIQRPRPKHSPNSLSKPSVMFLRSIERWIQQIRIHLHTITSSANRRLNTQ